LAGAVLRIRAEARVAVMLSRFEGEIDAVTIRLTTADGANGQAHKRCEIAIGLKPRAVRVEHVDADLSVALDRAADKAGRAVARAVAQGRAKDAVQLGSPAAP
jgi:putative sigma-54 modulation protein